MVSVIIPLYNHEKYILKAMTSVLEQTYGDLELIVIDDGSTDKSYDVAASISDPRVRLFRQKNSGAHMTINFGISKAEGEYVAILNSDDYYDKDRIRVLVDSLSEQGADVGFTDLHLVDAKAKILRRKGGATDNWSYCQKRTPSFKELDLLSANLLAGNFLVTTSNLFCKRSVFDKLGVFRPFRYIHDYDFFLRVALNKDLKTVYLDKPLCFYRLHQSNTISESQVKISYEIGLMFASLYLNGLLTIEGYRGKMSFVEFLTRVYNSLNYVDSERLVLSVILSGGTANEIDEVISGLGSGQDRLLLDAYLAAH